MSLGELLASTQALLIFVLMRIIDGPNEKEEIRVHLLTTTYVSYSNHPIEGHTSHRTSSGCLSENEQSQRSMQRRALEHTDEQSRTQRTTAAVAGLGI